MRSFWEIFSIIFLFTLTLVIVFGTVVVGVWLSTTTYRIIGIMFVLFGIPAVLAAGFCLIRNLIDEL